MTCTMLHTGMMMSGNNLVTVMRRGHKKVIFGAFVRIISTFRKNYGLCNEDKNTKKCIVGETNNAFTHT